MTNQAPKVNRTTTKIDVKTLDESGLVAALLSGHGAAWREFVRRYEPMLHKVLKRRLSRAMRTILPSDCADDVLQDFYMELLANDMRKLRAMSENTTLDRWLTMLVRQTATEHVRSAYRQRRLKIEAPVPPKDTDATRGADWLGMEQAERVPLHEELPKKRRRRAEREEQ